MEGTIYRIITNEFGKKNYGFISTKQGTDNIFFHKNDLANCTIFQLNEGDDVIFDVQPGRDGRMKAVNVRLQRSNTSHANPYAVSPGKNPDANFSRFSEEENRIIDNFGTCFYVTYGGCELWIGKSQYRYVLIKPSEFFHTAFHLSREIVVIFSDYVTFEPRSLDAYSEVQKIMRSQLRLEKALHIIVSRDINIEKRIQEHLKDNNLNQIIIPFSYEELSVKGLDKKIIEERFKKWLFDIDLFSDKNPVREDAFFFGRRDYVNDIVDKCKRGIHSGVFGLRRSGKTSILLAIKRLLDAQNYHNLFIPCESLSNLSWHKALWKIIDDIYTELSCDQQQKADLNDYNDSNAAIYFEKDLDFVFDSCVFSGPITLMFDEVEDITPSLVIKELAGNERDRYWADGSGFIHFWNTIKGYYSKHPGRLSILIAGTNPTINEVPTISGLPNPMYETLSASNQGIYLQPFSIEDTRVMVNTLGGYMGIHFDNASIARLNDDCGGHPYLIKMACSSINKFIKISSMKRPAKITKAVYDKAIPEFEKSAEAVDFYWMILGILVQNYETEFNTLRILATDGDAVVSQTKTQTELHHLVGYGLVDYNQWNYVIKYNTVRNFLRGEYKFERRGLSVEEQRNEICLRLDQAEIDLRLLIKQTLLSQCGKANGKQLVLNAMQTTNVDTSTVSPLDYNQLFDPSINKIFFSVLRQIVADNFGLFANIFDGYTSNDIVHCLDVLNHSRRCPAHSYDDNCEKWTDADFENFRFNMKLLESILKEYS